MKLLGRQRIVDFINKHPDCKKAIEAFVFEIESSCWSSPHDIKAHYPKASIIGNQNVVFNICGNKYRVWVKMIFINDVALVMNIGTHQEYDKWEIKK